ncbi:hypothetical protein M408DRAFT_16577 [Serendipita vermifera MAFF 305830]|uniref:Arrestin-like N-terminal domain-containing protein n=1 Tax=Serendipita vermifera MAFF 305830 TaxID=933852 RepID=A0A0C3B7R1_SERVB|nr:hypothetical protein M408DRAFT_16577 [Serendipita vermifera MAFF 305830]
MLLHNPMPPHIHILPRFSSKRSPSTGPTTASARLTSRTTSRSAQSTPSASPSRPSSPSSRVEQCFHLPATSSSSSTPWLSLRVKSNASLSKAHPLYFDRDSVEGNVCLNLTETPMSVVAIVVIVRGQLLSVGGDQAPFLELSQTLWSASMGHPSTVTAAAGGASDHSQRTSPFTGKLSGNYSWPFSIALPGHVFITDSQGHSATVPLPPTFAPKGVPSFIDYKIQVLVQKGPLKVDSTLTTSFVYLPRARAPRSSHLLESAYQNHHAIMGPDHDPDGWDTVPSRTLTGTLFNARRASMACTLSISRSPNSSKRIYARDCPIHLYLTFDSHDSHFLDLVSPSTIKLFLVQQIHRRTNQHQLHTLQMNPSSSASPQHHLTHRIYKPEPDADYNEPVMQATCWRASSSSSSSSRHHSMSERSGPPPGLSQRRCFEAEMIVRKDLKPSFTFPMLSLQVSNSNFFPTPGYYVWRTLHMVPIAHNGGWLD